MTTATGRHTGHSACHTSATAGKLSLKDQRANKHFSFGSFCPNYSTPLFSTTATAADGREEVRLCSNRPLLTRTGWAGSLWPDSQRARRCPSCGVSQTLTLSRISSSTFLSEVSRNLCYPALSIPFHVFSNAGNSSINGLYVFLRAACCRLQNTARSRTAHGFRAQFWARAVTVLTLPAHPLLVL